MPQFVAVLLLVLLTLILLGMMRRGWNNRRRRILITELPALPPGPRPGDTPTHGIYVSTTLAGQPYERVVTRGLGVKSAVDVFVGPEGILLQRQGADNLYIPAARLTGVSTTSGMIGKFAAADSIIVITWSAGGTPVDTGIHIRGDDERSALLADLATLLDQGMRDS